MSENEVITELLELFKALSDRNRLKIVGLLAQRPHAVEELAEVLAVGPSTVSHHLSVLSKAGLVSGKVDGYYNIYSLQSARLEETAKRLLQRDDLKGLANQEFLEGTDPYDQKVLKAFMTSEGRIKAFPIQEKKFLVILRHVLRDFQPGIRYTEKQVNGILSRFSKDTARLRRALVDYKFMAREGGGGKYWRVENVR